ncbi:MAG: hypothetical protein KC588_13670 [Nitrospira sp.]|nr:hypothetical protein [Nitrospira sp.]
MGPMILFDKSTLQSLNVDEACWLDTFYLPIITPLFFVETLADLEKEVRKGRTPEQVVGNLADKTPPNACAHVDHSTICIGELLGYPVPMDRRPVVRGGRSVATADQRGVVFVEPPEMKALNRWQKGNFLEIERDYAKGWRQVLSGIDLEGLYQKYLCRLRSLEEVREKANELINKDGSRYTNLKLALETLHVKKDEKLAIVARWKLMGGPPMAIFAPYTAHVLTVDLFFNLAVGADLISRERPSNKIDIAYLYYLPFCMIFVSNDKLHARTAKCFLKDNQLFLDGSDLKADLVNLDKHYSLLPDEVKLRGVMSFASCPPHEGFLTTSLWDRFMRSDWRIKNDIPRDQEMDAKLVEHIKRLSSAAEQQGATQPIPDKNADFMLVQKVVPVQMGKWRLIPPESEKESSQK